MTAPIPDVLPARGLRGPDGGHRRTSVPSLIAAAWAALFVNVLGWSGSATLVAVPHLVGQLIAQAALAIAVVAAVLANRRLLVRPQLFLVVLLATAVLSVLVSVHSEYLRGSTYRAVRFVAFVGVLWLTTPWFGRRDMVLLRCHLAIMRGVLATVILGLAVSPGTAFSFQGRLSGIVWPIPPTQVAHYAAVLVGVTTILGLCHIVRARTIVVTAVIGVPILLATHTRTALLACVVGLAIGGGSLLLSQARVRRAALAAMAIGALATTVFSGEVTAWMLRGQSTEDASQLTGRTKVWHQIASLHRDTLHALFGNGISNMSYNGLPIDSSWMSTYLDEGWVGIALQVALVLVVLCLALTRGRGPQRAVALFIVSYCVVASITETGLGAPSPYLLDLTVACAVLATPLPRRWTERPMGVRA